MTTLDPGGTVPEDLQAAHLIGDGQIPHDRVRVMTLGDMDATWTAVGRNIVEWVVDHGFNFFALLHLNLGVR